MTSTQTARRHRKLRLAAWLLIIQGALMEASVFVALVVLRLLGADLSSVSERFSFIVPYLQENLPLMMVISGVFGALRIVGAAGLLRNRMWGLALSLVNCAVTLALMILLLPAGIADGLLSGTALVLILQAWLGPIIAPTAAESDPRPSLISQ